jgi:dTDP-4-amino-4,6-dideoxygalactose transaminase
MIDALRVPFVDLCTIHAPIKDQVLERIGELIDRGDFTNGEAVTTFERAFAEACRTPHCVGLASGLDALRLGLVASGLQPGDGVIVPANTFIATFEAITQAGGVPIPVDAGWSDYNLDPFAAEQAIAPRTRFLLPVHLYGQLADMRSLGAIAAAHGATILEDACQAHGARRDGLSPGADGRAAAFSFYPGKNLGAMGDAGALVTGDCDVAAAARALREHGQREKYRHELIGWTARLDTIQAIVLQCKLPALAAATSRCATCTRYAPAILSGSPTISRTRASQRVATTRNRRTCRLRTRIWGSSRAPSRWLRRSPRNCCRCRSTPG